jgi:glycosyltransferase involved in cell wall biosynthesis
VARVLIVGKGAPERGGIPSYLHLLMAGPLADRHRLELLNLAAHGDAPEGGRGSWHNVRRTLRDTLLVWRRAGDVDVVHVHSAGAPAVTMARLGLLVLAARLRGARVLAHVHGGLVVQLLAGRPGRLVATLALRPASRVLAVAATVHQALDGIVDARRLELLRNGVDLDRFRPSAASDPDGPPKVLFVGVLTPRKGVLDLFEASDRLRGRGVEHELWLAGGTPDEGGDAEQQVTQAAPAWTRWLGRCSPEEMPDVYAAADVFCLPSWWEGTPLTALEAMASGLPVVASSVGDLPDLVVEGATGHLVPARDPQALALALEALVSDATSRRRLGSAARQRAVDEFDVRVTLQRLDELYSAGN